MPRVPRTSPVTQDDTFLRHLEMLALADLRPHARNDGAHPPEEIAHLRASIREHDIYRNVVVANDGTTLAGHGVILAAQAEGKTHIPGYRMPYGPDDPRALKLLVGDNHVARLREHDDPALARLLQEIAEDGAAALLGTGFDEASMQALLESVRAGLGGASGGKTPIVEPAEPWDRLTEVMARWKVSEHDLWACGEHRILCGDCLDAAHLDRLLDGRVPQMVFADPPYGVSIVATNVPVGGGEAYNIAFGGVKQPRRRSPVGGGQRHKDVTGHYPIESWNKEGRGTDGAAKPFGSKVTRGTIGASGIPLRHPLKNDNRGDQPIAVGKYAPVIGDDSPETAITAATYFLTAYSTAVQVWWGGNYYADHLPASACWLIWDKETTGNFADCELAWTNQDKAARLFHHRWNGMLRASEHERRWHPTQKPAALAGWVYETLGAPGDLILDPFLGSAPSLLAAEQTGRTLYGMELSVEYVSIALERWAQLTDQTPKLIH